MKLEFGKYVGVPLEEVPRSYLERMVRNVKKYHGIRKVKEEIKRREMTPEQKEAYQKEKERRRLQAIEDEKALRKKIRGENEQFRERYETLSKGRRLFSIYSNISKRVCWFVFARNHNEAWFWLERRIGYDSYKYRRVINSVDMFNTVRYKFVDYKGHCKIKCPGDDVLHTLYQYKRRRKK